jgi:hypothetical protein
VLAIVQVQKYCPGTAAVDNLLEGTMHCEYFIDGQKIELIRSIGCSSNARQSVKPCTQNHRFNSRRSPDLISQLRCVEDSNHGNRSASRSIAAATATLRQAGVRKPVSTASHPRRTRPSLMGFCGPLRRWPRFLSSRLREGCGIRGASGHNAGGMRTGGMVKRIFPTPSRISNQ